MKRMLESIGDIIPVTDRQELKLLRYERKKYMNREWKNEDFNMFL